MEIQEILQGVEIFQGLSGDELDSVAQVCQERSYRQGELVFGEGSTGDELYIVKSGKIAIQTMGRGYSPTTVIHVIEPNQVFGELALVDKESRSAGAKAVIDSEVLILTRQDIYGVFEANHYIGHVVMHNLATLVASRLRKTNLQLLASQSWK